jgi:hypothetical protein
MILDTESAELDISICSFEPNLRGRPMGSFCGRRVSLTCDGEGDGSDLRLMERDDEEEKLKSSRQAD